MTEVSRIPSCGRSGSRRRVLLPASILSIVLAIIASRAADPAPVSPSPTETRLLAQMAARGTNTATLFQLGDICHDAGVAGDKQAIVRAEAYLRQLLELDPTNAPGMALLGSVYTLKARDAFWPNLQLRFVREGNELMDQAVRAAPEDIRTRIIRALNNAHMPEFLGRSAVVRTDLAWLWERIASEPAKFTTSQKQEIALHWGRLLKRQRRMDEARAILKAGRDFDPESRHAGKFAQELEEQH